MDSWVPLVKLVSGVDEDEERTLNTSQVILEEHLMRFDFYANLIKEFWFSAAKLDQGPSVSPHIFPVLYLYRPHGLFPSLKSLTITWYDYEQWQDLSSLFSMVPSAGLSEVSIEGMISPADKMLAASILQTVRMKSPKLTGLRLQGDLDPLILDGVRSMNDFKNITLSFCHFGALEMNNPTLGTLSNWRHAATNFNRLENLVLVGPLSPIEVVVKTLFSDTPRLQCLHLSLTRRIYLQDSNSTDQENKLRSLVDEITGRQNLSLDSFIITGTVTNGRPLLARIFDPGRIEPPSLLQFLGRESCQQLKTLYLSSDEPASTILLSIPSLSRSIEQLTIRGPELIQSPELVQTSALSFYNLYIFKKNFPNLKYLSLTIDLSYEDDLKGQIETFLKQKVSNCHGLEELQLQPYAPQARGVSTASPLPENLYLAQYHPSNNIKNLLMIARFIDHLFPHLKTICTIELQPFVMKHWLEGLKIAVRQFREVRESSYENMHCCNCKLAKK